MPPTDMWLPLILFILLVLLTAFAIEWRERKRKPSHSSKSPADTQAKPTVAARPEGCCGEHLVCEQQTLLHPKSAPDYYDDEQLDELADIPAAGFSSEQYAAVREVFDTLREEDVEGWCRSLEMRRIELPQDIREEALLIVKERRNK